MPVPAFARQPSAHVIRSHSMTLNGDVDSKMHRTKFNNSTLEFLSTCRQPRAKMEARSSVSGVAFIVVASYHKIE